jgi:Secretion system C-terminal sorting domain
MRNFYFKKLLLSVFVILAVSNNGKAQCTFNYLLNPSFENPVQGALGNNLPLPAPTSWTTPAGANSTNLVQVNGTDYVGGPNTASAGIQYIDLLGAGTIEQAFNLGCTGDLTFRGDFSAREGGSSWTASIEIVNALNVVVATSTTRNFAFADRDQAFPGPDAIWYTLSGTVTGLPAGAYTFRANLPIDDGNFDNAFLCASPGCLLPVNLKAFDVKLSSCVSTLNWSAETETNFDKYIVEYSQNGIDFNTAGTVNASNSSRKEYVFTHVPVPGKAFYRLKMVDLDDKLSYSKIIVLNINCNKNTTLIYPNPVSDQLNINISTTGVNNFITASLYDATGRIMVKKQLVNGTNAIDMRTMASGLYSLVLIQNNEITTYKIKR